MTIGTLKTIPGKRIKTWHRNFGGGLPLRLFARYLVMYGAESDRGVAIRWLRGKGARFDVRHPKPWRAG